MRRPLKRIYLILFLLLQSCETLLTLNPIDHQRETQPGFGRILLSVGADAKGDASCLVVLRTDGHNQAVAVSLDSRSAPRIFEVPAGKYMFHRLKCGGRTEFNIRDILKYEVEVPPGKTALLGHISVAFNESGDHVFIRLTDGRAVLHREFQDVVAKSRSSIISAYNGKPVSPSMYSLGSDGTWNYQFFFDPNANPRSTRYSPQLDHISQCEQKEFEWNPLRLGNVQMTVQYRDGKFIEAKIEAGNHTFSDAFMHCIQSVLKDLRPDVKGSAKLQVSFR